MTKIITIGGIVKAPGSSKANETGAWRSMKPIVDISKCKACWICNRLCPDTSISKGDKTIVIDYSHCKGCGICAQECPFQAITMEQEEK